jgi:hypothetical protein
MKAYNFKTVNGKVLETLFHSGELFPIHLPTSHKCAVGESIQLTYGNRSKPVTIGVVSVLHAHEWQTETKIGENLIVRKTEAQ